ncbi:MAG: SpoIID/LytB domain-containing protein [Elusimicrobia bacterium]|nr:SpoIID/LytB domain-containing protein [Elusimicrobiota bacterium]
MIPHFSSRPFIGLLLPFFLLLTFKTTSGADQVSVIRIGILHKTYQAVLKPLGNFSVSDIQTGEQKTLNADEKYLAEASDSQEIKLGPYSFGKQIRLAPMENNSILTINQKNYRGKFIITAHPEGTLTLVEEINVEDYLAGVLGREMSSHWPLEALKAQAVISRTFALKNLGRFNEAGFDLSADNQSQVYGGSDQDDPKFLQAVQSTQGQVLTYKGNLISTYFHACCGGHTTSAGNVWGKVKSKSLRGVPDTYCRVSPHYAWKAYLPNLDIMDALQKNGFTLTQVKGIRIWRRDQTGHVLTLKISSDKKPIVVRANDFRNWIGNTDFRSTLITQISSTRKGYEFRGRGWGHGVGLCQWGAKIQAEKGRRYTQILKFYYPDTQVRRLE